ncbi:translation elongation factor Ts [Megalodesulfovibrio paquesii]
MAAISAQQVKDLREKTGAGMMDCKKALAECEGDEAKAVEWLRAKGLAKAAKKAGRATGEGLVGFAAQDGAAALVELMCETDFVARNEGFQALAAKLAETVVAAAPACSAGHELVHTASEDCFLNTAVEGRTVQELVNDSISVLGENMQVGRLVRLAPASTGGIGAYVHANGKIGVLVEILCTKADTPATDAFKALGKDLAMQVAAANPVCCLPEQVPAEVLDRERAFCREQTLAEGKPENIVDKIVEGRMQKFYKEICLQEQPFIKDDKKSIKQLLAEAGKAMGDTLTLGRFVRLALGEGAAE